MRSAKQIFAGVFVVLGVLLIVKGAWGGVWPLSVQFIAGIFLLVFGVVRLRYLS